MTVICGDEEVFFEPHEMTFEPHPNGCTITIESDRLFGIPVLAPLGNCARI